MALGGLVTNTLELAVSYRIKYGLAGKEKYVLEDKLGCAVKIDPATGNIVGTT